MGYITYSASVSRPFVVDTWHSKLKETPAPDPVSTIPSSFSHKILHRASSMLPVLATTQEHPASSILPLDSLCLGRTSRRGVPERLELDAEGGAGTGPDRFCLVQQSLLLKGVAGAGWVVLGKGAGLALDVDSPELVRLPCSQSRLLRFHDGTAGWSESGEWTASSCLVGIDWLILSGSTKRSLQEASVLMYM